MLTNRLAAKYAQAIYELAIVKNMLDEVERQFNILDDTVTQHKELSDMLYHPRVPPAAKKEVIARIFTAELAGFVFNFLFLLIDKRRETALPAIIREYTKLANQSRNIGEAEVTTAVLLSEAELASLAAKLGSVLGKSMVLKTRIDSNILGGVIVKIGDKLIDGSVVRQIQMMKSALMKRSDKDWGDRLT
jgi:F-type H+-transporting ATPase subunit delta